MKSLAVVVFALAFACGLCLDRTQAGPARRDAAASAGTSRTEAASESDLRAASSRAIALIQRSQSTWRKAQTCVSCHHVLIPQIPLELARSRNIPVDETIAREFDNAAFGYIADVDLAVQHADYVDVFFDGWLLVGAHSAGLRPNTSTAAYSQFIASLQLEDGSWRSTDGRPPQACSPFSATAICARAVQLYLPEGLARERTARLQRARAFLRTSTPVDTEDRAYRLLGLAWTGASAGDRSNAASDLLAHQRDDGGWSELPWMASDAYSTGLALYALRASGAMPASSQARQRALQLLLRTQQPDGSWHVRSRLHPPAPVSPPYFESGFPYGHDQFISAMATSWAVTALMDALPPSSLGVTDGGTLARLEVNESAHWIGVVLAGSERDVSRLLSAGFDPNSTTKAGTSALMLAARDLGKVKLLVAHGADVNASAATGITPLMMAAHFHGNAPVVRYLLDHGARPDPAPGAAVLNDASAFYFGVLARDPDIVRLLAEHGARRDIRMKILGIAPYGALAFAASSGDTATVRSLLDLGADPNELDDSGVSPLAWAAIYGRAEVADLLIQRGANVNFVDGFGMTPAMYAASVDYGDTAVLKRLVAAGADLGARNREGQRAVDLARGYGHTLMASLLASRPASP
jgi:ankyrin repeat protein